MNKPLVIILMATYNPELSWLKEQLVSLNNQTYENMELLVCDDCSSSIDEAQMRELLKQYITRFSYRFIRNEQNLGSNKTFERLTIGGINRDIKEGSFFAYCDQDDVWESCKIETLVNTAAEKNAVLAYSDMSIIDGEGNIISDSITKIRKRFEYFEGYELWRKILIRNFISGCCMIIRANAAKAAIPFECGMQHDRWLSVIASMNGYLTYVNKPLIRYRQHGKNQTGVLKDITDKQSYIDIRLKNHLNMLQSVRKRTQEHENIRQFMDQYIKQMETRLKYATGKGSSLFEMIRYLKYNKPTILFEMIVLKLPDILFKQAIKIIINRNL